ncbi:helix-turn-helix domain-containing protein [Micromonospora citrea]|uniref:helix-turn-helix domain-containing protein n=1 Tax=Micromonospora citrea TaxID=47855 RepID=UPI000AC97327|nr:helix-turn-helix transcriptional regulator [Micromonospora citrea]
MTTTTFLRRALRHNSPEGIADRHRSGYTGGVIIESAKGGPADALRQWRTRRRVSQLEPAMAGTTQRHVSFTESGRSTPGRSMVIRLAESLEVPIPERNELLLAAGFAPAYPHTDLHDPAWLRSGPPLIASCTATCRTRP